MRKRNPTNFITSNLEVTPLTQYLLTNRAIATSEKRNKVEIESKLARTSRLVKNATIAVATNITRVALIGVLVFSFTLASHEGNKCVLAICVRYLA
jgi:hypothetical protein